MLLLRLGLSREGEGVVEELSVRCRPGVAGSFPLILYMSEGRVPQSRTSHLPFRDRKKKRFVGQSGQEDKKKIKTESGRYISSSYKRDLYPKMLGCGGAGPGGFLLLLL